MEERVEEDREAEGRKYNAHTRRHVYVTAVGLNH